jgi:hypothetical protein
MEVFETLFELEKAAGEYGGHAQKKRKPRCALSCQAKKESPGNCGPGTGCAGDNGDGLHAAMQNVQTLNVVRLKASQMLSAS